MTISSTTSRVTYTGTGLVDTYDYTFKINASSDLLVTVRDTDDVEDTLTLTSDYTVTGAGESGGGSITLVAGNLASGYTLVIRRVVDMKQETDLRNQTTAYAETYEDALDKLTMADQQQQDELDRSFKLPETVSGVSAELPVPSANKFLSWNDDADALENISVGSVDLAIPADESVTPSKLSDITPATNKMVYMDSASSWATSDLTAFARTLLDDAAASNARTTLGLGSLATLSSVATANLAANVLSADATGLGKMQDGFLSADTAGRAKMADGFVTSAKISSLCSTSASESSFTLPGGLIVKFGTVTKSINVDTSDAITFGTAFPTSCYGCVAMSIVANDGSLTNREVYPQELSGTRSASGVTFYLQGIGSAAGVAGYHWLAWGV